MFSVRATNVFQVGKASLAKPWFLPWFLPWFINHGLYIKDEVSALNSYILDKNPPF